MPTFKEQNFQSVHQMSAPDRNFTLYPFQFTVSTIFVLLQKQDERIALNHLLIKGDADASTNYYRYKIGCLACYKSCLSYKLLLCADIINHTWPKHVIR